MKPTFLRDSFLQMENKALKQQLKAFHDGTAYQKLRQEYEAVIREKDKEINRLKEELAQAHEQNVKVRDLWFEQCEEIWKETDKTISEQREEIKKLHEEIWDEIRKGDTRINALTKECEDKLAEKDRIIEELENNLAHAMSLLERDGTTTGLPTSKTPINKNKVIPNSRRPSGKKKGGQPGHEKHTLESPAEDEVNDIVPHDIEEDEVCPDCGSENKRYTGKTEEKYEYDVQIKVIRRKHVYYLYECLDCGTVYRSASGPNLMAKCQYGSSVQAIALSLMNTVNAPMNKVPLFLSGITLDAICPSEGYVAKLQKRAYKMLAEFDADLYVRLIELYLIYWDDTVIMINKQRGCYRFYGDEKIAYYTAHETKGMVGLDKDNVLNVLTDQTTVMHDHNKVNYNSKYHFRNIECNVHLGRDCEKVYLDSGHEEWAEIKTMISQAVKERNDLMKKGVTSFDAAYVLRYKTRLLDKLEKAEAKNRKDASRYFADDERRLINRIREYYENTFSWLEDFSLPHSNNLSERALRSVKSHCKISGQFESVEYARYHARIKTYLETCRRNGFNEIYALQRLSEGNPIRVAEIFHDKGK